MKKSNHVRLLLNDDDYWALNALAAEKRQQLSVFVREIVTEWLDKVPLWSKPTINELFNDKTCPATVVYLTRDEFEEHVGTSPIIAEDRFTIAPSKYERVLLHAMQNKLGYIESGTLADRAYERCGKKGDTLYINIELTCKDDLWSCTVTSATADTPLAVHPY